MAIASILLVDDDPTDQYICTRALLRGKVVPDESCVHAVDDGQRAMEFLRNPPASFRDAGGIRVILLDINMPILDGFGFLEELQNLEPEARLDSTFIVLLTSSDHWRDRQRAAEFDRVAGYLVKYPDPEELARRLNEFCRV